MDRHNDVAFGPALIICLIAAIATMATRKSIPDTNAHASLTCFENLQLSEPKAVESAYDHANKSF